MDWDERLRATILSTIIRDTPKSFWEGSRVRTRQTYTDIFHEVAADPNVVPEQRIDKLLQDRHFRMERLLSDLAASHGFACSPTILVENNRHYVYATKGAIGVTQTYVRTIGETPQPARYRERLAALNAIPRSPRFDLGDEPREVLIGKDFYGLLAHNPVGRRFVEGEQRLGMLQFCVPVDDCSTWAAQFAIEEIVAAYPVARPATTTRRDPVWRATPKKEEK